MLVKTGVLNFRGCKTNDTERPKFFQESHKQAWEDMIKRHKMYSDSIYQWLKRENDEVINIAGVDFIQHKFK